MYASLIVKYQLLLSSLINRQISKDTQVSNCMKIRPVAA